MTHFTRFKYFFILNLSFFSCFWLAGCKTKSCSVALASQSATASETASRRTFYRSLDSLSRQLSLSADSISIIFSTEFPTAFPSEIEGCAETPSDSQAPRLTPQSLKIYGLHLNENIEKKSVDSADLKDSVNTFTQSQNIKSASKQSSKPSSAPYYIIFIVILILIIYTVHRLRRLL